MTYKTMEFTCGAIFILCGNFIHRKKDPKTIMFVTYFLILYPFIMFFFSCLLPYFFFGFYMEPIASTETIRAILFSATWATYLLLSRRVNNTLWVRSWSYLDQVRKQKHL